jgi:two-component system phosphate regulon sensor histidine kinase PhoR
MRVQKKTGTLNIELNASRSEILADEFHLTNSVYNILDNAEKYSKDKPEISITTSNGKNGLLISVRDAGIGIKERFQKHVFDKFFRVPTGDVHNVKGFGLGLSYVKTIVEAHKGSVSIQSQLDHGTRLDIYLPFE